MVVSNQAMPSSRVMAPWAVVVRGRPVKRLSAGPASCRATVPWWPGRTVTPRWGARFGHGGGQGAALVDRLGREHPAVGRAARAEVEFVVPATGRPRWAGQPGEDERVGPPRFRTGSRPGQRGQGHGAGVRAGQHQRTVGEVGRRSGELVGEAGQIQVHSVEVHSVDDPDAVVVGGQPRAEARVCGARFAAAGHDEHGAPRAQLRPGGEFSIQAHRPAPSSWRCQPSAGAISVAMVSSARTAVSWSGIAGLNCVLRSVATGSTRSRSNAATISSGWP